MNQLATMIAAGTALSGVDMMSLPGLGKGPDTSKIRKSKKERARMLTLQRQKEIQEKKGKNNEYHNGSHPRD